MKLFTRFGIILGVVFCALAAVIIVGCSTQNNSSSSQRFPGSNAMVDWMQDNGKIKVLSTVRMIDDLVADIGGDRVDRWTLIHGEIDPHSYEMVKGDDEKIGFAQIVFSNGLGLEHGASLSYRLQKHPHTVALGETIRKLQPEIIIKRGGQIDPHIWMDVAIWKEAVDPIVSALAAISPQEADFFRANGEALKERMMLTHSEIKQMMLDIPDAKRFLVTSHDSFHYFARAYLAGKEEEENLWQQRVIAPEGLAPEAQISSSDLQSVIEYLLDHRVNTIFSESNMSRDALRKIVEACGQKGWRVEIARALLHSDAMGPKGSNTGTYLGMMRHNAQVMVESWAKEKK